MNLLDSSLEGRRVIVTGGSRGLGRAMTLALMGAGARTAIVATRESAHLYETLRLAADIKTAPMPIVALGDLTKPVDSERIADEIVKSLGGVEALVNNAGVPNIGPGAPFWTVSADHWLRMSHANTDGMFLLTKCIVPYMLASGFGRIVNISTSERTIARRHMAPYGPTKAFVEAASLVFAQDLIGSGVTVNVLAPGGAIDTQVDVTGVPSNGKSFLSADVMNAPLHWMLSDGANEYTGQRFVASLWDESLPLDQRVAAARQPVFGSPAISQAPLVSAPS